MAGQRELKKHLAGIKTTGKLANAMKTVATAKFSRLSALHYGTSEYSRRCGDILGSFSRSVLFGDSDGGDGCLYILFTGNKGLCGGYNSELCAFYESMDKAEKCKLIVCGKKGAELCKQKGIDGEYFEIDDMPTQADAGRLIEKITAEHSKYGDVRLVYRRFKNVMQQIPTVTPLFPRERDGADDVLFFPTREEVEAPVAMTCLRAMIYGVMVEVATGIQAATLMTMRNAADNAAEEAERTEVMLNRVRQSELTADVIESASGASDVYNN